MDITFNCEKCGQPLTIDEVSAGTIVKCPKCSESVLVPGVLAPEPEEPIPSTPHNLICCPDCKREVSKRAAACPNCGAPISGVIPTSDSSGTIRFNRRPAAFPPNLSQAASAKNEDVSVVNINTAYLLAIFLPFIGFFVGIYLMTKKETGHGIACMAVSIFAFFVWFAIFTK